MKRILAVGIVLVLGIVVPMPSYAAPLPTASEGGDSNSAGTVQGACVLTPVAPLNTTTVLMAMTGTATSVVGASTKVLCEAINTGFGNQWTSGGYIPGPAAATAGFAVVSLAATPSVCTYAWATFFGPPISTGGTAYGAGCS